MPARDAEATIGEAVASVLGQTEERFELIVVDDGSRTPVSEVLADLFDARLRIVRSERPRGVARARNTGLAAAGASLISQLDADDAWEPDYLETILPCFHDPAVGLAYSNVLIEGHPHGHTDYIGDPSVHPLDTFPKIAEQNPVPALTATARRAAVEEVGGWARWLRSAEDYHLWMRLARAGWRFAYVHRMLARYRWPSPGSGMSFDRRRAERDELLMFLAFAARHPFTPGIARAVRIRARRARTA
jgi:cellulose synthase/poly-beta-1,6-N-acetylglucosamine synthase-like glycosyltransferase